jgi:tetratricopeptide (TPR) repeat protein
MMLGGLAAGCAAPAAADDQSDCFKGGATDANIAACTRLIASSAASASERARVHLRRGFLYARRAKGDDFDRAIADANDIRRLDPSNAFALILRAGAYIRKGELDHALADLTEGRRLIPRDSTVSNAFGNYYFAKGDYDRAVAEFDEALRLNPENYFAVRRSKKAWRHGARNRP